MPTGLTLWIVFFTLWLYALQRATHRAFTVERDHMPGIPFEPGPISAATLVFHLGLTTVLLVVILSSVYQDAQMLWFGLPGFLAPVIQGVVLMMEHSSQAGARTTRRISPHWITEQWPFALLGLSVGVAGAAWWALTGSQFPLLLVGFSAFFLTTFRLFFTYQNEISVSPTTFEYVRSFPRLRTFTHRRPRTKALGMRILRRRRGVYDLRIIESGQREIELTACFSSREHLDLQLEDYFVRTEQKAPL
ncbi:MAG: hypothetical protein CME19_11740 [Gemmatimonadetes bacterium]|nr:hypothetical protein [Gemmatimonadota bacterium]|tara:strand:- start:447 stop:1190 length:744 start_codon:yes stop_codon:yes gene_type:complete